jgi:DNA-binding MarR family transcriptional regulator
MPRQRLPQHEPVGLLIGAARRSIKQVVGRRVGRYRLTPQQFWLLLAIQEGRAPSLGALADRLRGDQPTASRIVAALVRRKLVRVSVDPADRRRMLLTCTPAGDALRAPLAKVAAEIRGAVVAGMDDAEQEAIRAGLRKVIENMDRLDGEKAAPRRGTGRRKRG